MRAGAPASVHGKAATAGSKGPAPALARIQKTRSSVARRLLRPRRTEASHMLWTLVVVLLVLWALGLATSYTLGGLLHLVLLVALVIAVVQLLSGRRTV